MQPRLAEISPGEIRHVCNGCGRIVSPRMVWCDDCRKTQGKHCESCGRPSYAAKCVKCKKRPPTRLTERHREAVEKLWAEGATAKEVAEQIGVVTNYPGTMITNARKRGWQLPHRRPDSAERGRKWNKRMATSAQSRKRRIPGIKELIAQRGRSSEPVQMAVERMWAEGFTAREISENMGWQVKSPGSNIAKARKRGWNLPYRAPGVVAESRSSFSHNAQHRGDKDLVSK